MAKSFANFFSSLFVGSTQSYLAAIAIALVITLISLAVFLSKKAGNAGAKIGIVLLFILISLPGILLTLFDITCLVTAGPGCDVWAWIKTLIILLYSILIIVALITLLAKHKDILSGGRQGFAAAPLPANAAASKAKDPKEKDKEVAVKAAGKLAVAKFTNPDSGSDVASAPNPIASAPSAHSAHSAHSVDRRKELEVSPSAAAAQLGGVLSPISGVSETFLDFSPYPSS